jgi:hypothetical protein
MFCMLSHMLSCGMCGRFRSEWNRHSSQRERDNGRRPVPSSPCWTWSRCAVIRSTQNSSRGNRQVSRWKQCAAVLAAGHATRRRASGTGGARRWSARRDRRCWRRRACQCLVDLCRRRRVDLMAIEPVAQQRGLELVRIMPLVAIGQGVEDRRLQSIASTTPRSERRTAALGHDASMHARMTYSPLWPRRLAKLAPTWVWARSSPCQASGGHSRPRAREPMRVWARSSPGGRGGATRRSRRRWRSTATSLLATSRIAHGDGRSA